MTIHESSWHTMAQVVDSPLNGQFNDPRQRSLHAPSINPVDQRMFIILGLVSLLVIAAVLSRPIKFGTTTAEESVSQTSSGNGETAVSAFGKGVDNGISPVFSPQVQHWAPQIVVWAGQYNLDPDIVATIMQIESCGDPQAASYAGAQGLFQVMPFHFAADEVMLDPDTNARRGMAYYAERLQQTGGDVFQAFAGYNGGHVAAAGNWNSWADETQRYYIWSKGIYEDAKSGQSESHTLQEWMQAGGASLCQQASNHLNLE